MLRPTTLILRNASCLTCLNKAFEIDASCLTCLNKAFEIDADFFLQEDQEVQVPLNKDNRILLDSHKHLDSHTKQVKHV